MTTKIISLKLPSKGTDINGKTISRKCIENKDIDFEKMSEHSQISIINQLYLDLHFKERSYLEKQLKYKLSGYKAQDVKNKIYDNYHFIKMDNVVELLVKSKLHCVYCSKFTPIIYSVSNDKSQWTLDRINNDEGHNNNNVNISCLECNLERKTMDVDRFTRGKKFKFVKVE